MVGHLGSNRSGFGIESLDSFDGFKSFSFQGIVVNLIAVLMRLMTIICLLPLCIIQPVTVMDYNFKVVQFCP